MKTHLLVFLAFFLPLSLLAQDPHFSQFFANRVYLNPAYAGFDPGWTLTLNYRNQWFGIPDGDLSTFGEGYRTYQATADAQIPCMFGLEDINSGVAVSVFRDEAGGAPLVTQGAAVAFSFEQPLMQGRGGSGFLNLTRLDLRVGGQLSWMQKMLSGRYFLFSDQLDPVIGIIEDPTVLQLNSPWFPNLNVGVMLRGNRYRSKNQQSLFTVGFALSNVNRPDESIRDVTQVSRLPIRTTFHLGTTHRIARFGRSRAPAYIAPQFRWDSQSSFRLNVQTLGAYVFSKGYYGGLFVQYNFPAASDSLFIEASNHFLFKNTTTLILNAGIDLRSVLDWHEPWHRRDSGLVLGLTYDLNLTGLTSNNTLGVLELTLRMNIATRTPRNCGEIGAFELYDGQCPIRF
jgi:type IX secretion system PorP/SprF family membrane protein